MKTPAPSWLAAALGLLLTANPGGAAPIAIQGRVLHLDGNPFPEARVQLVAVSLPGAELAPPAVMATTSDRGGRFELLAPEPGMWRLVARARGHAAQAIDLFPLLEPTVVPAVRLAAVDELRIHLAGPQGEPVPVGWLAIQPPRSRRGTASNAARLRWTGADLVESLPPDRPHPVWAEAGSGLALLAPGLPASRSTADGQASSTRALRLSPGLICRLRVVGTSGEVVAGAKVRVEGLERPEVSDERGLLALPLERDRPARLAVETTDGRWAELALPAVVEAVETGLTAQLLPPTEIKGRVSDQATGGPLAEAWVWSAEAPGRATRTDAAGRFRLALPFHRSREIMATALGYLPTRLEIAAGSTRPLPLRLAPALTVAGTVESESGRPIAGVELVARPQPGQPPASPVLAMSDRQGWFRLSGLAASTSYWLEASADGFLPARNRLETSQDPPPGSLRLVLRQGRAVIGRVVDSRGRPIAGARVMSRPSGLAGDLLAPEGESKEISWAHTDAAGGFALPAQRPGRLDLSIEAHGFARHRLDHLELEAEPVPLDLGVITLAPGADLEGVVISSAGAGIAGAQILAVPVQSDPARPLDPVTAAWVLDALTDSRGAFVLPDLQAGLDLEISARHPGYVRSSRLVAVEAGADPIVLELAPAAGLAGRVVDEAGGAIAGARVIGYQEGPDEQDEPASYAVSAVSDAQGHFLLAELEPGRVEVTASAAGFLPARRSLDLDGTEASSLVDLTLSAGGRLTGQVLAEGGEPVAGATLEVADNGTFEAQRIELPVPRTVTDASGLYQLAGLRPGGRRVEVRHRDFLPLAQEIEVGEQETRLDLVLSRGTRLSGRVADHLGHEVAGAQVRLTRRGGLSLTTVTTDLAGAFSFTALAPGDYLLVSEKPGLPPGSLEARVEPGVPPPPAEIRLPPPVTLTGTLLGLAPEQLARVEVWAYGALPVPLLGEVLPDGRFVFANLTLGEWRLRAAVRPEGPEVEGAIRLDEGTSRASLDLDFGLRAEIAHP